jgi:hypothetical protein
MILNDLEINNKGNVIVDWWGDYVFLKPVSIFDGYVFGYGNPFYITIVVRDLTQKVKI